MVRPARRAASTDAQAPGQPPPAEDTASAVGARPVGERSGSVGDDRTMPAAPPSATKVLAAATAPMTDSEARRPSARAAAAATANRSPAPQGSPMATCGGGATRGAPAPSEKRAPSAPRVTA